MDRNTTLRPFVPGSLEATRLSHLLARPLLPPSAPQDPHRFCWPRFLCDHSVVEELPPMLPLHASVFRGSRRRSHTVQVLPSVFVDLPGPYRTSHRATPLRRRAAGSGLLAGGAYRCVSRRPRSARGG